MKLKMNKVKAKIIVLVTFFLITNTLITVQAAENARITFSGDTTLYVGETGDIEAHFDTSKYELVFDLVASNGNVTANRSRFGNAERKMRISANKVGSTTFTVRHVDGTVLSNYDDAIAVGSFTVNVKNRQTSGGGTGGGTTGNGSTGSYKPLAPKETEAEQKAREEAEAKAKLEAEKKIPLVESIDFFSESERLKGEQVLSVKTENDTFKYSVTLPRNIEAFKLDLKPTGEDVTLEYEKMFKLDEGHDKVEIKAVATKGEITQEYNISVNRYKESELTYDVGDEKYNLLVDTLIDEKLDALGIKKHLVDSEKNKDAYYYQYEGLKFVLTYDSKGIAHFFFVDDQAQLAKEFILFSDEGNKPHFIVDVELEEPGTIRRNKYEKSAIDLPEFITNLDASTEFYNSVSHWTFDETGIITHELKVPAASDEAVAVDYNDVEQVYIGEGRIVSAFVNFDIPNTNMMYLAIVLGSLLALTLIIFIAYWRNTNKRINKILKRND